ncbi:MAG TPA: hypothetical protein VNP96_04730 [Solirubrobacterales bacterium]|nr:hypothetical protein [Solirubrobacterales bacterium]
MPRRPVSFAAVVFALLVLATIGAFAWSQRLKRDPLVLDRVSFLAVPQSDSQRPRVRAFTPNGDCRFDRIRIRFRVTRSDRANVQVVKPGGKLIVTLARDTYLKRYRFFTFYWDGRVRNDGIAPPGRYKLRVKLLGQDRTLVPGGVMRLHRARPGPTVTFCLTEAPGGKAGR